MRESAKELLTAVGTNGVPKTLAASTYHASRALDARFMISGAMLLLHVMTLPTCLYSATTKNVDPPGVMIVGLSPIKRARQ